VLLLKNCCGLATMLQPNSGHNLQSLESFVQKQFAGARAPSAYAQQGGSIGAHRCTLRYLDLRGCAQPAVPLNQGSHVHERALPAPRGNPLSLGSGHGVSSAHNHSIPEGGGGRNTLAGLLSKLRDLGCTVLD
jgi:hypothetical protein